MLSIAFDAKRLFNNHTGLGNYSRTLVHNLAHYHPDAALTLFTPSIDSAYQHFAESGYPVYLPPRGLPAAYWRSIGIKSDLKSLKPHVYHGLSHELPMGLSHSGIKQVVTMHDLIFRLYPETFRWIDRQIFAAKWSYSIRHADKIIAISQHTASDLREQYNLSTDRIEVVYQACSEEYYAPLPDHAAIAEFKAANALPESYLLSVGSIIPRKNLLRTVQALALIPNGTRPVLVIVGEGKAYKRQVMDAIARLGLEKYVFWWPSGQVDTTTLRLLYAGARATVFPSLYEGFGLPVAESLLCNTPVITSRISSLPEAAGPGGLLIDPLDTECISDAMMQLLLDDEICRRRAKEGYTYAREMFDPERTARQLYGVYVGLCGGLEGFRNV